MLMMMKMKMMATSSQKNLIGISGTIASWWFLFLFCMLGRHNGSEWVTTAFHQNQITISTRHEHYNILRRAYNSSPIHHQATTRMYQFYNTNNNIQSTSSTIQQKGFIKTTINVADFTKTRSTSSTKLNLLPTAVVNEIVSQQQQSITGLIELFPTESALLLLSSLSLLLSSSSVSITSLDVVVDNSMNIIPISPEPIHTAFTIATFFPQPFWILLILFPNLKLTKIVMGGMEIPLLCCLVHFFIVVTSIFIGGIDTISETTTAPLSEFNNVFNPIGDPQLAFMGMTTKYPNFVAEEWSHVLTWDIFVGRYIWLDGIRRKVFTGHSVLLSNLIGPPGLLLHWFTCVVFYKEPIVDPNEKDTLLE